MIPAALILLLAGLQRLMATDRWPRLGPVRARWCRVEPRVASHVRSAPGTYVYLFILLITTWVLETSSGSVARRLLQERSTNLYHLSRDPVRVLVSSAFWVSSAWQLLLWLVLFAALVAPVEQWLGTSRTAMVFFAGHIGATLLTAAGLWIAVRTGLAGSSIVNARDVGASYGFLAVAPLLADRMQGRRRLAYLGGLVGFVAIELGLSPDFTSVGHVLARAIGLLLGTFIARRAAAVLEEPARRPQRPEDRRIDRAGDVSG